MNTRSEQVVGEVKCYFVIFFALKYCLVEYLMSCVYEDGREGFNETLSVSIQNNKTTNKKETKSCISKI